MKAFGFALAAWAALALGSAPPSAQAQAKSDSAAKVDKTIKKDQQAQGMKEAPAVVQTTGKPCTVTDAYFLGKSGQKSSAGKEYQSSVYEVACKEGLGYIVMSSAAGEPTKSYDCLTTQENASMACRLPGNADPKSGLTPLLAAAGQPCTITNGRAIGATPTGQAFYEVACQEGEGYILQTAPATAPKASSCLEMAGSNAACTLTPKTASVAAVARIAAQSGKPCQVSDAKSLPVTNPSGDHFFEVACGAQPGFMVETDAKGKFKIAVKCADAIGIGGGCSMTDVTQAQTAEVQTYTGLAKAAGFNCNVSKYRFIGMQGKDEVVELACSNRADGTVAVFPAASGVKPRFVDCVRGGQFGPQGACKLTSLTPIYAKYSGALAARGRSSCKVSGARYLGQSPEKTDYIETACADGGPGWVIELTADDTAKTLLSCGQAGASNLKCQLPTNQKH